MPLGALIGPMGHTAETLSEEEHEMLQTCLEMYRSYDPELHAIAYAIGICSHPGNRTLPRYLRFLLSSLGEHVDAIQGMLVDFFNDPVFLYQHESYFSDLSCFLKILRNEGWFAEFLSHQVRTFGDSNGSPTPLQLMQSVTNCIVDFECQLEIAKRMYEQHPGLVAPKEAASHATTS